MQITLAELNAMFSRLNDETFNRELRGEVRELLKIAENSENFRAVSHGLFVKLMESITIAGVAPKPFMASLLSFLVLGYRHAGSGVQAQLPAPADEPIPLTPEDIEKMRREIDEI